jgi:hypothetical protein
MTTRIQPIAIVLAAFVTLAMLPLLSQAQNVGIEVPVPTAKLDVNGTIRAGTNRWAAMGNHPSYPGDSLVLWRYGSDYALMADTTRLYLNTPATGANQIDFRAGNQYRNYMDGRTGNYGIGGYPANTTKLYVNSINANWATLFLNYDAVGAANRSVVYYAYGGGYGTYVDVPNATSGTYLTYIEKNDGVNPAQPILHVGGTGNIGIGNLSTTVKLQIKGDHTNTGIRMFSDQFNQGYDGANTAHLSIFSEADGLGIGNNVDNTYARITGTRGGSFIRLRQDRANFVVINAAGTSIQSFAVMRSFSPPWGPQNNGAIKIGNNHTLNAHDNTWLYTGNQTNGVFAGTGIATDRVYTTWFQLVAGGANGRVLRAQDAAGTGQWQDFSVLGYDAMPAGHMVGLCVTNSGNNCNTGVRAPITGWGTGCPTGYTFREHGSRYDSNTNRRSFSCFKN